jgi:hypothetical protein
MATRKRYQTGISGKRHMTKKQKLVVAVAIGAAVGLIVAAIWPKINPEAEKYGVKDSMGVTHYYSPLTGVETTAAKTLNHVTGVMIENSTDARPQAGLVEAGIVYEAVAEGGITRFLALYQEAEPELICPVRSVRAYYLEWSVSYGASIAHVGGSGDALVMLKTKNYGEDLDQSYYPSYFWRESSRYAPHDVCTTMDKLRSLEEVVGAKDYEFTPFARQDAKPAETADATNISIPVASGPYEVSYRYDPATNKYLRFQGGQAHLDQTKGQVSPDVVIAMDVDISLRSDNLHNDIYTIGTDHPVLVFQNGTVQRGTWLRGDDHSSLLLRDSDGRDIPLNRGQTWITAIGDINSVSWDI